MLTLGEIIRAPKVGVTIGSWKSGRVPASAFPIIKQKRFPQQSSWSWRVVEFEALGYKCRVLIRLNTDICYYSSILAIEQDKSIQIVCHHELHLSHFNWHCHFARGNVLLTIPGILRDRDRMRVYEAEPSKRDSVEFGVEAESALAIAAARFRFPAPDETPAQRALL